MALNIKNRDVERLAAEVAALTGESKTQAIRKAPEERRQRLSLRVVRRDRRAALVAFLEREIWPEIPPRLLGKRFRRAEENHILGYGPKGV
ncbi:MAG: hypothetical protein KatS3mg076_2374 [Candidatus Binatia bacterium]|nr:MAG: hypothetical protein KatS3mg076_2374 [Candidatus Binatia bacterium]